MATQKEQVERLKGVEVALGKVAKEIDTLKEIAENDNASEELVAQIGVIEGLVKGIDDKNPDVAV